MRVTSRPGMSFAVVICSLAISSKAWADKVDLRPNGTSDRIAVVSKDQVTYLPARRIELVKSVPGSGHARYIRRTSNGDLYVTGAGLEGTLLHSRDGGSTWKSKSYSIALGLATAPRRSAVGSHPHCDLHPRGSACPCPVPLPAPGFGPDQ